MVKKTNVIKKPEPNFKQGKLYEISQNKYIKSLPAFGTICAMIGNGISTVANLFPMGKAAQKKADLFGDIGTKAFLFCNGNVNALEQFLRKNYMLAVGYFLENVIMVAFKQSKVFLARGIVSGLYTLGNALSMVNKQNTFNSLGEHIKHIGTGLWKSAENLMNEPISNLASPNTGLMSVVSGLMKITGTSVWLGGGSEKVGSSIRNAANIIQNFEQIKLKNASKRPHFFKSGIATTLATILDYISKWLPEADSKAKQILVPLSLLSDFYGVFTLRSAQLSGEISKKLETQNT